MQRFTITCPNCNTSWDHRIFNQPQELPVICRACNRQFIWKWDTRVCAFLRENGSCYNRCSMAERHNCTAFLPNGKPAPAPEVSLEEECKRASEYVVGSGRHEGKTLAEIYGEDEWYLEWLEMNARNAGLRKMVNKALIHLRNTERTRS